MVRTDGLTDRQTDDRTDGRPDATTDDNTRRRRWRPGVKVLVLLCMLHVTHLPLDKMAAILADDNFKCIFLNENDRIPIRISLKFVPMSPVDNKPALIQEMARRRTGDKPLLEQMLTHFTDAYMRHYGEMSSSDSTFKRQN